MSVEGNENIDDVRNFRKANLEAQVSTSLALGTIVRQRMILLREMENNPNPETREQWEQRETELQEIYNALVRLQGFETRIIKRASSNNRH